MAHQEAVAPRQNECAAHFAYEHQQTKRRTTTYNSSMSGIRVRQFGLLVAVLAAFPSLCCGQFTLAADVQPGEIACCHSESQPHSDPCQPTEPVEECCCQESTLPTSTVRATQCDVDCSLSPMAVAEPKPSLTTGNPVRHHLAASSPPLRVLQCVWLI